MTTLTHEKFVEGYKLGKVSLLFDVKKASKIGCEVAGDSSIEKALARFLKFKKTEKWIWAIGILTLFTPLKMLFLLTLLYWAGTHLLERFTRNYITHRMVDSANFYDRMTKEGVVQIGLMAEQASQPDNNKESKT